MAKGFDFKLVDQVRLAAANNIVDIISEHLKLDKKGKEFVGLCPFHTDKRPSMYVNPVKGIFKCFACGAGGDVFKFLQMRENLTFTQAVQRLAERAGIQLKPIQHNRSDGPVEEGVDPTMLARVNAWAMKYWQKMYGEVSGKAAKEYVAERKISEEMATKWNIGFAPDSWDELSTAAMKAGITETLLVQAGLAVARENGSGCYDKFRNRLMFPILDPTERVIGFGGRTLCDDSAKYMNSPTTVLFDKSNNLFGLNHARHEIVRSSRAVVVEGYTDVIMSHQYGVNNVVAALGTSFTSGHARLLRRFAKEVILVFDSDIAGQEAANRALEVCLTERLDIKIAMVSEGKDPCDFLISNGKEAFESILDNAVDVMEFKWNRFQEKFSEGGNLADRKSAVEDFLGTAATAISSGYIDAVSKGLLLRKLGNVVGMNVNQVQQEIRRIQGRQRNTVSYDVPSQKVVTVDLGGGYVARAQKEIVEVLLNDPHLFELAAVKIEPDDFSVPVLKWVYTLLDKLFRTCENMELGSVLMRIEDESVSKVVIDLSENGEVKGKYKSRLEDALEIMCAHKKEMKIKNDSQNLSENETEKLKLISKNLKNKNLRSPGLLS